MTETVSAIRRVLAHGSSFPSVVETTSRQLRVMKLSGAGPGRRALATEYLALQLARGLDLNVPDALLLLLPPDLPWQVGTDEFHEAVQRSVGLNLGVALIPEATDLKAADLHSLPEDFLGRLGAIDALLQNVDRTEANPNIVRDGAGVPWAIDFGACLLIDRLARGVLQPKLELPPNHFWRAAQASCRGCARLQPRSTAQTFAASSPSCPTCGSTSWGFRTCRCGPAGTVPRSAALSPHRWRRARPSQDHYRGAV